MSVFIVTRKTIELVVVEADTSREAYELSTQKNEDDWNIENINFSTVVIGEPVTGIPYAETPLPGDLH